MGNHIVCNRGIRSNLSRIKFNFLIMSIPLFLLVIFRCLTCSTWITLSSNDVWFTLTLATKRITFERYGTLVVTIARQCTSIVVGGQWEYGLFTEIGCIQLNVEMILTAFLDELLGLIDGLFLQQIVVELSFGDDQNIIQPNAFLMYILFDVLKRRWQWALAKIRINSKKYNSYRECNRNILLQVKRFGSVILHE